MQALFVTLMVVMFSLQSLFTRLYSAHYAGADKTQAVTVFSMAYGVLIAAASWVAGGFAFAPGWQTWLLALLNAGMLALYNQSMIEAGNRGSYAFLMMAGMFGGILVPLAADVLLLGVALSTAQALAVVLMLVSLVLMNAQGFSLRAQGRGYYGWCAALFLSNGLYGTIMDVQARVMAGAQRTEMLIILFAASAVAAALPKARQWRRVASGFRMGRRAAAYLLACCACATAAANLLLWLLPRMDASVLYTIDNGGVLVLSLCYAMLLFGEKPKAVQLAGMALALVSIGVMNLG